MIDQNIIFKNSPYTVQKCLGDIYLFKVGRRQKTRKSKYKYVFIIHDNILQLNLTYHTKMTYQK